MITNGFSGAIKSGVLSLSTVFSLAAPALAADAKLESGSVCSFSNNSTFLSHAKRNGFRNDSGGDELVVCPVVKENLGVAASTSLDVLTSVAVNGGACSVTTRPFGGGSVTVHNPDSVEFNNGTQFVHWDAVPTPGGTAVEVECTLPDGEQIFSIQHAED
jgi:hypothetical protein